MNQPVSDRYPRPEPHVASAVGGACACRGSMGSVSMMVPVAAMYALAYEAARQTVAAQGLMRWARQVGHSDN